MEQQQIEKLTPTLTSSSCADGCDHCPLAVSAADRTQAPFTGRTLGVIALCYYIIPILFALVGVAIFPQNISLQALGGTLGLGLGVLLCIVGARILEARLLKKQRLVENVGVVCEPLHFPDGARSVIDD